jgi:hypothetical protein
MYPVTHKKMGQNLKSSMPTLPKSTDTGILFKLLNILILVIAVFGSVSAIKTSANYGAGVPITSRYLKLFLTDTTEGQQYGIGHRT